MGEAQDAVRSRLGAVGAWTFAFDGQPAVDMARSARAIEDLGLPTLWIPEGSGSTDLLTSASWLLASTHRLTIASGIANITARAPEVLQRGGSLIEDAYGGRFVLGVGVGHEYSTERRGLRWDRPLTRMRAYLDAMDGAAGHAGAPRLLAALGDRMLALSAERALGAHTYFVPPEHSARARERMGPDPVLAVEQTIVLESDPGRARALARDWARHYLELPNYAGNWARLGYADDLSGGGSDRLLDAGIAWGSVDGVVARVRAHLDAGADHVCVQVVGPDDADPQLDALAELAPPLLALHRAGSG